ncbi:unnamed protein product [Phytomonas sp. Hart1]|nr:unnamed protein product [Phytomonas sp. Hart1]|eukprot:CCW66379.1 unnamed protein product [Phytomonas sp. isolate Hart1]
MKRPTLTNCRLDLLDTPTADWRLHNRTDTTMAGAPPPQGRFYAGIPHSSGRSPPKQCIRVENRVRQREGEDTMASRYRRVDHITFGSIQQEIHMYLDSVATRSDSFNGGGVSAVDMAVHETFNILRSCWCAHGNLQDIFEPVRNISVVTLELLLSYGRHKLTNDGQYAVPRGGEDELPWMGCVLAVLASYIQSRADGAITQLHTSQPLSTHHRGSVHLVPQHAMHMRHDIYASNENTGSGILQHSNTPLENEEESEGGIRVPKDVREGSTKTPELLLSSASTSHPLHFSQAGVSRLTLLNCHNFGWLDELGNEDYESSSRFLRKVDSALHKMLGPLPQTRPTRRSCDVDTNCLTSSALRRSSCNTVLLSDAILMDGGVPSLTVTQRCKVFCGHKQYGQGIACLVAPIRYQGRHQGSSLDTNHATADAFPTGAAESRDYCAISSPLTSPQVVTDVTHLIGASSTRGNEETILHPMDSCVQGTLAQKVCPYYNANPSPPQISVVDPFQVESPTSASLSTSLSTVSTSSSSAAGWIHSNYCNLHTNQPWPPVSCGHHTGPGIVAQAILLAPMGPLVLHIQLERIATLELLSIRQSFLSLSPHAYHNVSKTQQEPSPTQPHPGRPSGAATHNYGLASFISTEAAEEPVLYDLAEWLLYLFQSPQPLLIVEWHLDKQRRDDNNNNKNVSGPEPPSAVLQLLEAYANRMSSVSPFGHVELRDTVHATCRSIRPCVTGTKFDGKNRPLIFMRELKAVVEMEHYIDEGALITSLQYC